MGLISPSLADAYRGAITDFNVGLQDCIASHGHRIAVVDINQLLIEIVTARRYVVGGLELEWIHPGNDARHLFLSDGFHPGTIGQCLIANRFLAAINARFEAGVPVLDGHEIVRIASSVAKPSVSSLIGTGILALFGYGCRRLRAARIPRESPTSPSGADHEGATLYLAVAGGHPVPDPCQIHGVVFPDRGLR